MTNSAGTATTTCLPTRSAPAWRGGRGRGCPPPPSQRLVRPRGPAARGNSARASRRRGRGRSSLDRGPDAQGSGEHLPALGLATRRE
jgi:hypothetical protein